MIPRSSACWRMAASLKEESGALPDENSPPGWTIREKWAFVMPLCCENLAFIVMLEGTGC